MGSPHLQIAILFTLLSISNFPVSQGLDCFHCVYQNNAPIPNSPYPITSKCEKKVPDEYKKSCTHPNLPRNFLPGQNSTVNAQTGDTCAKIHAKWDGGELIVRGCLPKSWIVDIDASKLGTCTSGNLKQLGDQYNMTFDIDAGLINMEGICFCDGDGCNSAISGNATKWMLVLGLFGFILGNWL